ncbi:MAG: hemerythrin domain-containing protein [Thiomonas arsenitoxydans]|nr:hemerythrin domain-containing protein [Thiomonas arsenitoxydans]
MNTSVTPSPNAEPIADFSHCHEGILKKLDMLGELPALLEPALRAREVAEKAVDFFREAIFEHHQDEERELFPAVLASAQAGAELAQVKALVKQLTDEHRALEAVWKRLEPGLKKVAKGQAGDVAVADVNHLVTHYRAHAEFEEAQFLPLSQLILSRNANHMGALGLSLHMRHRHATVNATYI